MGSRLQKNIATEKLKHITGENPMLFSHFSYKYAGEKLPYGTEKFFISQSERHKLQSLLEKVKNSKDNQFFNEKLLKKPRKIIIDTDIGTDFDDVLALLMTLHLDQNDIKILGITTNYYPTLLRKHIVQEILSKAGSPFNEIPVFAGPSALCGSHREYFHHGNEGKGLNLCEEETEKLWQKHQSLEAIEFIYSQCKENTGEITIISIGILTNIGLCTYLHQDFQNIVGHIVVMGGGSLIKKSNNPSDYFFELPSNPSEVFNLNEEPKIPGFHLFPNHNIGGDTLASKFLFDSQSRISLIPHHVTAMHWLEDVSLETLLHHGHLGQDSNLTNEIPLCGRLAFEWLSRRCKQRGQCVHDPLTAYEAIYWENDGDNFEDEFIEGKSSLKYLRGTIIVHEWAGFISFVRDPMGIHRIAVDAKDPKKWLKWLDQKLIENVNVDDRVKKWHGNY